MPRPAIAMPRPASAAALPLAGVPDPWPSGRVEGPGRVNPHHRRFGRDGHGHGSERRLLARLRGAAVDAVHHCGLGLASTERVSVLSESKLRERDSDIPPRIQGTDLGEAGEAVDWQAPQVACSAGGMLCQSFFGVLSLSAPSVPVRVLIGSNDCPYTRRNLPAFAIMLWSSESKRVRDARGLFLAPFSFYEDMIA